MKLKLYHHFEIEISIVFKDFHYEKLVNMNIIKQCKNEIKIIIWMKTKAKVCP